MFFDISHEMRTRITSLCTKIKSLKNVYHYPPSSLSEIFIEKNKYNLPLLMAEIISHLEFADRSEQTFLSFLSKYNEENGKNISFNDFESIFWIRILHNEIHLPSSVSSLIRSLIREFDKELEKIPMDKRDLSICLLRYYEQVYSKSPVLNKEKMDKILIKLSLQNASVSFLISKSIIKFNEDEDIYYWGEQEHYPKSLNDETVTFLWLLHKDDEKIADAFYNFFNLIRKTHFYLNDLSNYLPDIDCKNIYLQSIDYLKNEKDLINTDKEVAKTFLDSERYSHDYIFREAPPFDLSEASAYELLIKIEDNNRFGRLENFQFQKTRSFCFTLLRYVIEYEIKNEQLLEKSLITEIINEYVSRPYLIFNLFFILEKSHPEVLPWLHTALDLSPLSLRLLYEFEINYEYFSNDYGTHNKFEKCIYIKNDLSLESFEIFLTNVSEINRSNRDDKQNIEKNLVSIFLDLSRKIFNLCSMYDENSIVKINALLKLYSNFLNSLQNRKTDDRYCYYHHNEKQALFPVIFGYVIDFLKTQLPSLKIIEDHDIKFYYEYFHVIIDFIKILNNQYKVEIIPDNLKQQNENYEKEIVSLLVNNLLSYFNYDEFAYKSLIENRWICYNSEYFDFIDWGSFFILLNKYGLLTNLDKKFFESVNIDSTVEYYNTQNRNQTGKLIIYLRIIYKAYLSIKNNDSINHFTEINAKSVCDLLEKYIIKHSKFYSVNNLKKSRLDVFTDYPAFINENYAKPLIELLFDVINNMPEKKQTDIIKNIFSKSIKLDKMLMAINIIKNENVKEIINKKIEKIKISKFIESCFMITSLENAVFEALYNDKHWEIAQILNLKIKEHYNKVKINDEKARYFLYRVDLLTALRKKDIKAIQAVQFSGREYNYKEYKINELKQYFIAVHKIDNEKDYVNAITLLKRLISTDPKNLNYGINILKAAVCEALKNKDVNIELLNESYSIWDEISKNPDDIQKIFISNNNDEIKFLLIPYYIFNNKLTEFNSTFSVLSDSSKYDELYLEIIYNYYCAQKKDDDAYKYLNDANCYYKSANKTPPELIKNILSETDKFKPKELKDAFNRIISTYFENIPQIIPDIINMEDKLNMFILNEITNVLKQMLIKIQTIRQLSHEDHYTDIVQSVLKLRFPFYGWSINDHSHTGISGKGEGPGEPDLIIESRTNSICIIEALKLKGKSISEVHRHIKNCLNYLAYMKRCYIIVYFTGKKSRFNYTWEKYQEDFKLYKFPKNYKMKGKYLNLTDAYESHDNLKTIKSNHGTLEIFHTIVNFGTDE